jgi:hypothetical protein
LESRRAGSNGFPVSWLTCRLRDGGEEACGRGRVTFGTAGRLVGHFYIHKGDDSGFACERD